MYSFRAADLVGCLACFGGLVVIWYVLFDVNNLTMCNNICQND